MKGADIDRISAAGRSGGGTSVVGARWLAGCLYAFAALSAITLAGAHLALSLLVLGLLAVRPRPPVPWRALLRMLAPFWLLAGVGALSVLFGERWDDAVPRLLQYRLLLLPLLLVLAFPFVSLRTWLQVLCVAVIGMGLYGVFQSVTGLDPLYAYRPPLTAEGTLFRARGGFTHPLSFSGYLLIVAPVFTALALADHTRTRRFWIGGAAVAVLAILAAFSRSGFVGLATGALVLLFLLDRRVGGAVAVLACVAGTVLILSRPLLQDMLTEGGTRPLSPTAQRYLLLSPEQDTSAHDRLLIWQAGLLGFLDRPVFGFGIHSHDPSLAPYQREVIRRRGLPGYEFTVGLGAALHNMYVRLLFEQGVIGLAAYLALWASVFASIGRALRRRQPRVPAWPAALMRGLAAGLAGSMAAAFFEDNFYDAEVQTLIVMSMSLALYLANGGWGPVEGQNRSDCP